MAFYARSLLLINLTQTFSLGWYKLETPLTPQVLLPVVIIVQPLRSYPVTGWLAHVHPRSNR
jgi:hypothetical protein